MCQLVVMQHPYPTEDEKRQIAAQTNLTLIQVNNWSVCFCIAICVQCFVHTSILFSPFKAPSILVSILFHWY